MYLFTLVCTVFHSCDLDLDLMTLIYKLDLGIVKIYPQTTNEVSWSRLLKVTAKTCETLNMLRHNQTQYHGTLASSKYGMPGEASLFAVMVR